MDPDEALAQLRALCAEYNQAVESDGTRPTLALGIVDEFQALDDWLTNGGFLPADWTPNTRAE